MYTYICIHTVLWIWQKHTWPKCQKTKSPGGPFRCPLGMLGEQLLCVHACSYTVWAFFSYSKRQHSLCLTARESDPGSALSCCLHSIKLWLYVSRNVSGCFSPKHLTAELVLAPQSAGEGEEDHKHQTKSGCSGADLLRGFRNFFYVFALLGVTDGLVTR